ncbi:hypothetical protein [Flavobacterium ginsenosidimutans]|nr:hypothetical protein [Flavobacterium ginsenosidimutans]KAF2333533.1 hypothetical protein DM444_07730 [Flavobacterium ginsenosidimutans]
MISCRKPKNAFEASGNVFSEDLLMKLGIKVSSSRLESSIVLEITGVD